jgi:hypothetical protein
VPGAHVYDHYTYQIGATSRAAKKMELSLGRPEELVPAVVVVVVVVGAAESDVPSNRGASNSGWPLHAGPCWRERLLQKQHMIPDFVSAVMGAEAATTRSAFRLPSAPRQDRVFGHPIMPALLPAPRAHRGIRAIP